ncbi:MAG: hypothetical protein ABSB95_00325 [Dissulfurispiraceae bacterium]|jgi:hypothetical protein
MNTPIEKIKLLYSILDGQSRELLTIASSKMLLPVIETMAAVVRAWSDGCSTAGSLLPDEMNERNAMQE